MSKRHKPLTAARRNRQRAALAAAAKAARRAERAARTPAEDGSIAALELIQAVRGGIGTDEFGTLVLAWMQMTAIGGALLRPFKSAWDAVVSKGKSAVRNVISAVGWLGSLPGRVAGWFGRLKDAAVSKAQSLASWMRGLPGRIRTALGNLGGLLYNAGRNVIQGLINGIRSMISNVGAAMSGIASKIRGFLPFSPAKEGPLAGTGAPNIAGGKIGAMLAAGIAGSRGDVAAAMGGLASAATFTARQLPGGVATRGGDGAAAPVRVIIDVEGADGDMKRMFRRMVRVDGGGSVQVAFGGRG